MRSFDFQVAPGGVFDLGASGRYLAYLDGSGGAAGAVTVRAGGVGELYLLPGQAVRLPVEVTGFRIIGDREAATVTGTLIVGDGSFEDRRLFGTIDAVQSGAWAVTATPAQLAGTRASASKSSGRSIVSVGSGYPYVFLGLNNAAPIRVELRALTIYTGAAMEVEVRYLTPSDTVALGLGAFNLFGANKLQGDAAGAYVEDGPVFGYGAGVGTSEHSSALTAGYGIWKTGIPAGQTIRVPFEGPIMLGGGVGNSARALAIVASANAASTYLCVGMEWDEVAV